MLQFVIGALFVLHEQLALNSAKRKQFKLGNPFLKRVAMDLHKQARVPLKHCGLNEIETFQFNFKCLL